MSLFFLHIHLHLAFVSLIIYVEFNLNVLKINGSACTGLMRMSFIDFMLLQMVNSQGLYHQ